MEHNKKKKRVENKGKQCWIGKNIYLTETKFRHIYKFIYVKTTQRQRQKRLDTLLKKIV